ncbi:MAG: SusD/RagB family nutrient-binding outer membrane lipoprotein [Chitinophagaceae bacterium]|nr:SusD/RagB family nutrient-binding outer membrane lipoprotein [Chitinophagaceae bacterium]
MHKIKRVIILGGMLFGIFSSSCRKHLEQLNQNPNGANPATTNPNLVLSTVLTATGQQYVKLGFGDIAGVMQHTQADGWTGNHNEYDWSGSNDWSPYYDILRNNKYVYDRSVTLGYELQQGVCLVMKSMVFGLIADLYGDAPYSQALQGEESGNTHLFPAFDKQQDIYTGVLADLAKANTLLSKAKTAYNSTIDAVDVYYGGEPSNWRKLANSLALRYYMRLSEKSPEVAKAGIEKIAGDPATYPILTTAAEDALMGFAGASGSDSWPSNVNYNADSVNYRVTKMCSSFVKALVSLHDPRIGVWANKVQVFLHVNDNLPTGTDRIADTTVDGEARKVRYLSPDVLAGKGLSESDINQDPNYVGIPPAIVGGPVYNMGPDAAQAAHNPHVSWLNNIYMSASGPLLKARLMTAAEVHFILAEAALKGWAAGDAGTHYNAAIKASLTAWGLAGQYNAYISQAAVSYAGTVEQIITQKWIASWTAATESWFDFRRTGYPALISGPNAKAPVLPIRFYYMLDERNLNPANIKIAEGNLEVTTYSGYGDDATNGHKNSAWSKPWVSQGTGKPW